MKSIDGHSDFLWNNETASSTERCSSFIIAMSETITTKTKTLNSSDASN